MEAPDDPYAILGVHRAASTNEVRKARNRLLLHWHPDHSADPQAAEHAARINAAYEVLSDPARRAAYDRGVSAGSLASILRPKPPTGWAPAAPDADRAAAQQRVVDHFRDRRRWARPAARRWSDTVAAPVSGEEIRVRLLARALPFGLLALASLVALPYLRRALPPPFAGAAPYLPVYAAAAVLRALAGRATSFAREGWGRFTLSWVVGVAATLGFDHWTAGHAGNPVPGRLEPLVPALLLLLAAGAVYGAARRFRQD